jgi:YHS domain-containing protein
MHKSMMRGAMIVVACLALAAGAAAARDLVNVDETGLAVEGYDPVAFHSEGKAVKGKNGITARHRGATYRFASAENKEKFESAPNRYAPAFGGFCAYGASNGYAAPVKIETWQVVEGRLLLNYDLEVKALFDADREGFLKKADRNWPSIVEKEGK